MTETEPSTEKVQVSEPPKTEAAPTAKRAVKPKTKRVKAIVGNVFIHRNDTVEGRKGIRNAGLKLLGADVQVVDGERKVIRPAEEADLPSEVADKLMALEMVAEVKSTRKGKEAQQFDDDFGKQER